MHPALRTAEAVVEVSIPTFISIVFAESIGGLSGLNGPNTFAPLIFIGLWTLALDTRLCLLLGAVAAGEHLALYLHYADAIALEAGDLKLGEAPPYFIKAGLYLVAGATAAFVAHEIKGRALASLRNARERDRIRDVFGQHVSPAIVDTLLARGGSAPPESRRVCVLFFDIRGFTALSEHMEPGAVVELLNRLFAPLVDHVTRHGGVVNKFLGDGFMAVFGAPIADERAEENAVAAGRAILEATEELVATGRIPEIRVAVGLHAGPVIAGDIGSVRRREYTLIGDTVNVAARIEALNREFDTTMLASAAVVDRLDPELRARARPLGEVAVRGRERGVVVYALR